MDTIAQLSASRAEKTNSKGTLNLFDLFDENEALDVRHLYFAKYQTIPNCINLRDIDCRKASKWLVDNHSADITDCHYTKRRFHRKKIVEYDDIYFFLFDDLVLHLNTCDSEVACLFRTTDAAKVNGLVADLERHRERKRPFRRPEISLLVSTSRGLDTEEMTVTRPKLSIEDNYNDDFMPIHSIILKRLLRNNDKGLVLLHGKPGTGKTSYIRYLITKVKKQVIFMPPSMATSLTNPDLMATLVRNPNSIFVIEDAENLIFDRNKRGNSPVSALLNLADGLLSDCLNIQIICSFNTDLSQVDSALMRKGRLIAKYEFTELETRKAQALSDKLGFHYTVSAPMTLTAIYNQDDADFQPVTRKNIIGFRQAGA